MHAFNLSPLAASSICQQEEERSQQDADSIALIEQELPYLRRYARALTRDVDRADDLVHDCVTRAIQNINKWQPGTEMRPWLIVMTRNLFYNQCRRARREREVMSEIGLSNIQATSPSQETSMEFGDVADAFASLSDDHREILLLVVTEGMSYEATAKILNICPGTVKSRLSRARQHLKTAVEHDT